MIMDSFGKCKFSFSCSKPFRAIFSTCALLIHLLCFRAMIPDGSGGVSVWLERGFVQDCLRIVDSNYTQSTAFHATEVVKSFIQVMPNALKNEAILCCKVLPRSMKKRLKSQSLRNVVLWKHSPDSCRCLE
jgi:hypothetical protein